MSQKEKMNLSNIIVVLKTLFNKETQIYEKRNNFLNKLNNLNLEQENLMNMGRIQGINNNRKDIYEDMQGIYK